MNPVQQIRSLRLEGLRKRLPGFTLSADFEVGAGERAGVLGRSGSGKTTLLRLIAGLDQELESGRVLLGGDDVTGLPPEKRGIGVVFQEQALFPALSVIENAAFALRVRGMGREERRALAMPWLERVGLAAQADRGVDRLSGGERQRVAFVRALVWKPRLLLLDEPFSALDSALRSQLRRELIELHRQWPVPLLIVTHDQADIDELATTRIEIVETDGGRTRSFVKRA